MKEKLKIKDLVSIGIFFVIYFVISAISGMMGVIPKLIIFVPFLTAVLAGTLIMLFMAKIPKPYALLILGMIQPMIMWLTGHTFIIPLVSLVFVGLAEFIFRKGKFKSFKNNAIAYALFSCWPTSGLLQIIVVWDKYFEMATKRGMSNDFLMQVQKLVTLPMFLLIILMTFVGGLIGAYIGKIMLKKHFEKAGIF